MAGYGCVAVLLFITGLSIVQAYTYCSGTSGWSYTCFDDEYCCGVNQCCDYGPGFFGLWYVWLIAIIIVSIFCSCIGCCVRAARRRRVQRRVVRVNAYPPRTYGTQVVVTPGYTAAGAPGYTVAAAPGYTYQDGPTTYVAPVHDPTAPPAYQAKDDPPSYQ